MRVARACAAGQPAPGQRREGKGTHVRHRRNHHQPTIGDRWLNDVGSTAASAQGEADEAITQAAALGATVVAEGLSGVKDTIDRLIQQINAADEIANEAITQARAVADGT